MVKEIALVTGASAGLGVEFATLLASDGYDLVLVARSQDRLQALADDLHRRFGTNVQVIAQDLSVPGAADAIVAQAPACDVLVNNAGFAGNGRFDTLDEHAIRNEVMVDVLALTELTRKYLPGMIARKSGRVLNVASTAGFLPGPFMAVYYASKAYVISFSEALWEELRGTGVTVSCLCPGATATEFAYRANMTETLLFKLPAARASDVARAGYQGMLRGKRVTVPWPPSNWLVAIAPRFSPKRLVLWMSRKAVER